MTASQRALAVVACSEWVPKGANRHSKGGSEPGSDPLTNEQLAAEADVTDRTIRQAKVVAAQPRPRWSRP
jgi:hypothetical protein